MPHETLLLDTERSLSGCFGEGSVFQNKADWIGTPQKTWMKFQHVNSSCRFDRCIGCVFSTQVGPNAPMSFMKASARFEFTQPTQTQENAILQSIWEMATLSNPYLLLESLQDFGACQRRLEIAAPSTALIILG